jgi:Xaa-Pro aminopeptidase
LKIESAVLISFYAHLEKSLKNNSLTLYEHDAENKLHELRRHFGGDGYYGPSFSTIMGSGPNGAIVHYRP